jgi:hypothetical protein
MYGYNVEVCMPQGLLRQMEASFLNNHVGSSQDEEESIVEKPTDKKSHGKMKERDWITVPEACDRAGVSSTTIKTWAAVYGIGIKVGGRYRINPEGLDKVLRGEAVKVQTSE